MGDCVLCEWPIARTSRSLKVEAKASHDGILPRTRPNTACTTLWRHPTLATDTHLHVLGPSSLYPYIEDREYTPPDALPSDCRRLFQTLGVKRAVLVQPSVYGDDHRCMLASATQLGIPTRNVVVITFETGEDELTILHEAGTRAVRFILAHKGWLGNLAA